MTTTRKGKAGFQRHFAVQRLTYTKVPQLAELVWGTKTTGKRFMEAEALGSRIRQKYSALPDAEAAKIARLKARVTLPKVKGYWE